MSGYERIPGMGGHDYYEDGVGNIGVESMDFRICMDCWMTSHVDDMAEYVGRKLACPGCGCKDVKFALVIDGVLTVDDGVPA